MHLYAVQAVLCRSSPTALTAAAASPRPPGQKCALDIHTFACSCLPIPPAEAKQLTQVSFAFVIAFMLGYQLAFVACDGAAQDHKAISVSERERIEKVGGRIEDGRVNGMLEVSRSFGDAAVRRCAAFCAVCCVLQSVLLVCYKTLFDRIAVSA